MYPTPLPASRRSNIRPPPPPTTGRRRLSLTLFRFATLVVTHIISLHPEIFLSPPFLFVPRPLFVIRVAICFQDTTDGRTGGRTDRDGAKN